MYRLTAVAAGFATLLHGVAFALGKFAADVQVQLVFAVFYLVLAFFLFSQKRLAAWSTFFLALAGLIASVLAINSGSQAPDNVFHALAVLSVIVAACAIMILWRSKAVP